MTPPPLLISVAPNGARRLKSDHAAIPLSPVELADTARACRDGGAGLIHLHVRDEEGRHSLAADRYRLAIDAVLGAVGETMIVQITTEAVGMYAADEQMAVVRAVVPQAASFALRELVPDSASEPAARDFFGWVAAADILPQFILYTPDEARRLRDLIDRAIIPFVSPPVLFVLGRYDDGPPSHPTMIQPFIDAWLPDGHWSVCAFGPVELAVAATAIALGGHVRVGFENNLWRPDGTLLAANDEQVGHVAAIAAVLQRPLTATMR